MILSLDLENFKAFKSTGTLKLAPITLIYGPNSGGKSSIIQSLILLKQSLSASSIQTSRLMTRGELVDLGTFKSIINGHDSTKILKIGVSYNTSLASAEGITSALPADSLRRIELTFQAAREKGSNRLTSSCLHQIEFFATKTTSLPGLKVRLNRSAKLPRGIKSRQPTAVNLSAFQWADSQSIVSFVNYVLDRRQQSAPKSLHSQFGEGPREDSALYKKMIDAVESAFLVGDGLLPRSLVTPAGESIRYTLAGRLGGSIVAVLDYMVREYAGAMSSISYLGPLRSHPARHYVKQGGTVSTVGIRGENTPQVIAGQEREIKSRVNKWFGKLGINYKLTPRHFGNETAGEIISINLTDDTTKLEFSPSDVGFGIGQLLPIIVEGLVSYRRTICVEQPEIHLHPRLQGHLADFLIDTISIEPEKVKTRRGHRNQWIVETHSEALMLRLQRRIREGSISPEDVSVLYVNPITSSGGSEVLQLRLDEDGEFIDEWPDGFFEESYHEVFAGR
ncbi:DUF3696 domain-containing protein [Methylorubrum podarium]|jgi:predicted ATPase|uniref:DUF3696 domain-containing protein n=1 Tax=Methylorubrum podarium TaxID=200476 RepID=UPI001EE37B3C|nr:DUF3696 domain-containing protein [Methylorubrum podarium]GJE73117.1 hypothetical protein CHKEEEPN_4680 [Methylorubrum podarium]